MNHPELSMGALSYDSNNAISFSLLSPKIIQEIITALDVYLLDTTRVDSIKIKELADYLMTTLREGHDPFIDFWEAAPTNNRFKQYAMSFVNLHLLEAGRIEIRAVRPQASMDVWVRQIQLMRGRIKYLETLTTPIKYNPVIYIRRPSTAVSKEQALNPMINAQEALRAFYNYVRESGEIWQDHRDYIWPQWIESGERDKFEHSTWFKKHERQRSCNQLMSI